MIRKISLLCLISKMSILFGTIDWDQNRTPTQWREKAEQIYQNLQQYKQSHATDFLSDPQIIQMENDIISAFFMSISKPAEQKVTDALKGVTFQKNLAPWRIIDCRSFMEGLNLEEENRQHLMSLLTCPDEDYLDAIKNFDFPFSETCDENFQNTILQNLSSYPHNPFAREVVVALMALTQCKNPVCLKMAEEKYNTIFKKDSDKFEQKIKEYNKQFWYTAPECRPSPPQPPVSIERSEQDLNKKWIIKSHDKKNSQYYGTLFLTGKNDPLNREITFMSQQFRSYHPKEPAVFHESGHLLLLFTGPIFENINTTLDTFYPTNVDNISNSQLWHFHAEITQITGAGALKIGDKIYPYIHTFADWPRQTVEKLPIRTTHWGWNHEQTDKNPYYEQQLLNILNNNKRKNNIFPKKVLNAFSILYPSVLGQGLNHSDEESLVKKCLFVTLKVCFFQCWCFFMLRNRKSSLYKDKK